jgi:hypothetical protein
MSEDEAKRAAAEDYAYWQELLKKCVPLDTAIRMVCARIGARVLRDKQHPKEPWQE